MKRSFIILIVVAVAVVVAVAGIFTGRALAATPSPKRQPKY